MTAHTPTPWRWTEEPNGDCRISSVDYGTITLLFDGHRTMARGEVAANAALIVAAVNERAALLDALNVALAYVVTPEAFDRPQIERNLRAVLAAAEDR